MIRTFELETLKMQLSRPDPQRQALHLRLQRALRNLILDGAIPAGLKLPATRALAESLGVSRETVENAYVQLQRDGFIVRRGGSGSYVSETLGAELRGAASRRGRRTAGAAMGAQPVAGLSRRGEMLLAQGGVQDTRAIQAFATGLPETRSFPTLVWERLQRQALREHRTGMLLHGDPQGEEPLREAIAAYLNLERGAKVTPAQIIVLSSTRQALYLCAQLLADAGQAILMEDPGYFGAYQAFAAAQVRVVPIAVDGQGIRTDLLRADTSGANGVYLTPSHQYPTGATLPLERRLDLIHWAAEQGKWIIEDDYDSEFHYDGLPTACVQGLDRHGRTIYVGTFSKTLYPGLRLGYMAVPDALVSAFVNMRSIVDGHTPQILQLTLARFMDDGHYNSHVRAMRRLYAARREVMLEALGRYLGDVVVAARPAGGLQIPCFLLPGWQEADTIRRAAEAGIRLPGLSRLFRGQPPRQGWLLGYASLTDNEIREAMRRLAQVLAQR
ncbi:MocR-like pyridoxine biosynthesis transcription factor PdxR [Kerstersia sp.]|uniref:MocR-like pyridoxine biosynthesis transcription factor PdxR n=1 Tax=Kerstersia sp. TaxID=1930783 RepID=UPI003F927BF2